MGIQIVEKEDVTVLSIEGNITREGGAYDAFLHALNGFNEANKIKIVIDFERCSYVNSSMLAPIFQLQKRLLAKGGDVKIACVNGMVRTLFKQTNLIKLVDTFASVESAVASHHGDR